MKFQHLILPLALWLLVGACLWLFVPNTPLVIGGVIVLISLATYLSLRFFTHNKLPFIVTCCVSVYLLSSVLSGFNVINLLLIVAIGTLVFSLTTSH